MKSIEKHSNDFFLHTKKYTVRWYVFLISEIIQIYCNYIELKTDFSVQVSGCCYLEDCLFQGRGKFEKKNNIKYI